MGALTTAALTLGGGFFGSKLLSKGQSSGGFSSPAPLPQAPSPEKSEMVGEEAARRKKSAVTKTVYGSQLGLSGEAAIAKKTLLGQ